MDVTDLRKYLHLNASKFYEQAEHNYKRIVDEYKSLELLHGDRGYIAREAITCVLFSAMSIEAFMNELPVLVEYYGKINQQQEKFTSKLAILLHRVEESQGQIKLKLLVASIAITGEAPDLSKTPYQDFDTLIKLRNELVHLKPQDKFTVNEDGEVDPSEELKKWNKRLRGLNILANPNTYISPITNEEYPYPFVELISTRAVAKWAFNTACDTIHEIIKSMPKSDFKTYIEKYVLTYWKKVN